MHKQLTAAYRKALEVLLNEQYTFNDISTRLKVDRPTIAGKSPTALRPPGTLLISPDEYYQINVLKLSRDEVVAFGSRI